MKLITLVVVILAVLSVVSRVRAAFIRGQKKLSTARCAHCGRPLIGDGPCGCGNSG